MSPWLIFLVLALLVAGREYWLLSLLPQRAAHLFDRGQRQEAKKLLERAIRRSSVLGSVGKIVPRYVLACRLEELGSAAGAAAPG